MLKDDDKFFGLTDLQQIIIFCSVIILFILYQFVAYPYFLKNKKVPFVEKLAVVKQLSSRREGKFEYVKDSVFEYKNGKLVSCYLSKYINVRDTVYEDDIAYYNQITRVLKDN